MNHANLIPEKFYVSRFRISCRATSTIKMPGFKGFALKDCFQQALAIHSQCSLMFETEHCESCTLRSNCLYKKIFKADIPTDNTMSKSFEKNPPLPFCFDPLDLSKCDYMAGETFVFDILLAGNTSKLIKKLIPVLELMGQTGVGSKIKAQESRGNFELTSIVNIHPNGKNKLLYADGYIQPNFKALAIRYADFSTNPQHSLQLNFIHPLMLFKKDKQLFRQIDFGSIRKNLLSRICLLSNFFCEEGWQNVEGLLEPKEKVSITEEKIYINKYRYSSARQQKIIVYTAIRGKLQISGISSEDMQLLQLGSHVFLGRNTASGFGKYLIN